MLLKTLKSSIFTKKAAFFIISLCMTSFKEIKKDFRAKLIKVMRGGRAERCGARSTFGWAQCWGWLFSGAEYIWGVVGFPPSFHTLVRVGIYTFPPSFHTLVRVGIYTLQSTICLDLWIFIQLLIYLFIYLSSVYCGRLR